MPFQHDIAGGNGNLVVTALQSPNFQHLVQGWQIARNGNAEFNALTIRGTFLGTNFIINSSGLFFYSGTPALGNLIASVAPSSGSDTFGNAYVVGLVSYGPNSSRAQLASNGSVPAVIMNPMSVTHLTIPPQLFASAINAGLANELNFTVLSSGKSTGNDDAAIQLFGASADNTIAAKAVIEFGGTIFATITKTGIILPGNSTPALTNSAASVYATTVGRLQVVDGADGVTYSTQRRTYTQNSNSAAFGGLTSIFNSNISTGTYRVHGEIILNSSSTGAVTAATVMPAGATCAVNYKLNRSTSQFAAFAQLAVNTTDTISTALSATTNFILEVDGIVTMTGAGTSSYTLQLGCTLGTLVVVAGSFLDVMPV